MDYFALHPRDKLMLVSEPLGGIDIYFKKTGVFLLYTASVRSWKPGPALVPVVLDLEN